MDWYIFFHAHFLRLRAVGTGRQGGRSPPPPDFGRWVKPIPTEGRVGTDYVRHITKYLPHRIFKLSYYPTVSSCFVMSTCNDHQSSTSFSLNQKMGFENSNWWKKINYHGRFLLAWLLGYRTTRQPNYEPMTKFIPFKVAHHKLNFI